MRNKINYESWWPKPDEVIKNNFKRKAVIDLMVLDNKETFIYLRELGKSLQEIADEIEKQHGIRFTRQTISNVFKKYSIS